MASTVLMFRSPVDVWCGNFCCLFDFKILLQLSIMVQLGLESEVVSMGGDIGPQLPLHYLILLIKTLSAEAST